LGTPRLITGNGGVGLSRHNYHPFGIEIAPASTSTTTSMRERKQFTGHERDAESLDYMHARFYAPYVGRFLSVDPVLGDPARPQSWNRYAYVQNNPIAYVDSDGRQIDLTYIQDAEDRNLLIEQLRERTGLDLAYENDRLVSNGTLTDADGNALGSAIARTELSDAIASETVFTGRSMDGSSTIDIAASAANTVFMDFNDIGAINVGSNPAGTVNTASIFMHELRHARRGTELGGPHGCPTEVQPESHRTKC
jgi:RHS repeat-associated protein